MIRRFLTISAAVLAIACVGKGFSAEILTLDDGNGHSTTLSSATGFLNFNGSLGDWSINVTTGISDGTADSPHLDLNSIDKYVGSGGLGSTLKITFTEDGIGPFLGGAANQVGGTLAAGMTGTFDILVNGSSIASQTFQSSPFSGTSGGVANGGPLSTFGLQALLTANGTGIASFDSSASVPDGGATLALLGFALVGVEGFRRQLRSKISK